MNSYHQAFLKPDLVSSKGKRYFFEEVISEGKMYADEDERYEQAGPGIDLGFITQEIEIHKSSDNTWTVRYKARWNCHFQESYEPSSRVLEQMRLKVRYVETKRSRRIMYWIAKDTTEKKNVEEIFNIFFKGKCKFVKMK